MKPTVGRIVHYHKPYMLDRNRLIAFAAIITGVDYECNMVGLTVFLAPSLARPLVGTQSLAKVAFSETPMAYHWSWPPKEAS